MKSSNLSNSPGYSLLALYMPMATLTAQVLIVDALFPEVLPVALLIASGAISALAASFYCDFMKDTQASRVVANIRGGIIVIILFYIFASLLRGEISLKERFVPALSNVLASAGALFTWTSVVSLKRLFSARKLFEVYTETYEGEELKKALFEDSGLLRYTDARVIKARRHYLVQLIIIGIFTAITLFFRDALPLPLYLFLIFILAGGICIFGFFGIIRWEQYYAGEGIGLSARERSKRILGMGVFALLSIITALLLVSEKSILSFSMITSFFAWFFGLFRRLFHPIEQVDVPEAAAPVEYFWPRVYSPEENTSMYFWGWLMKNFFAFLKYAVIIFLAVKFILFMISPLLNRGRGSEEKPVFFLRLGRMIAELFRGIWSTLVSFLSYLKGGKTMSKLRKHTAKEIRLTAQTIVDAYSPAKKRDMRQSVTLFARLIIWGGETRHVAWKPVYAPMEYCVMLAAAAQDAVEVTHNDDIIRCGELFEQALYSAEVLSDAERQEFKNLVEKITENSP